MSSDLSSGHCFWDTSLYQNPLAHLHSLGNDVNIPPWSRQRSLEAVKDWTSKYGTKLRSTFQERDRVYVYGCKDPRRGYVLHTLCVFVLRAERVLLRVWSVYSTYGRFAILQAVMSRESMTSPRPFFKCSLEHISVCFYTGFSIIWQLIEFHPADSDPEEFDTAILPDSVRMAVEADTFWCLSRLLDGIQDNYIAGQPGIHRSVKRMAELVARIDGTTTTSNHLLFSQLIGI